MIFLVVVWYNKKRGEMSQIPIKILIACLGMLTFLVGTMTSVFAQSPQSSRELDARVEKFLNENRRHWHAWNVP